jgi:hypothetical protein
MKKLSEIQTGEKFAFGERFFMGVELTTIDQDCNDIIMPIDLETGKYGLDGKGEYCDPDTMVFPCSWEEFKCFVGDGETDPHLIEGMMLQLNT